MNGCKFLTRVERWFDGELVEAEAVERHLSDCLACRQHLAFLEKTRAGVGAVTEPAEISDAQMPAFLEGIREEVARRPKRRHTGLLALASVACAALISTASVLYLVSGQPTVAQADTVVESHDTEIEGATTEVHYSDDGTATVWINLPDGAMM